MWEHDLGLGVGKGHLLWRSNVCLVSFPGTAPKLYFSYISVLNKTDWNRLLEICICVENGGLLEFRDGVFPAEP